MYELNQARRRLGPLGDLVRVGLHILRDPRGEPLGDLLEGERSAEVATADQRVGILQVVEQYGKPVVVVSLDVTPDVAEQNSRLESLGIPVYPAPERAAKALAALWRYARAKARLATASATQ